MPKLPTLFLGLLVIPAPLLAAEAPIDATASLVQMLLALALIIGLLFAALHLVRRGRRGGAGGLLHVLSATAVGPRERVVLLAVGDRVLVLGVAPGRVCTLATLDHVPTAATSPSTAPPAQDFQSWLKRTLERRA
jgi:flagellar protein FliO/FliZ